MYFEKCSKFQYSPGHRRWKHTFSGSSDHGVSWPSCDWPVQVRIEIEKKITIFTKTLKVGKELF